MDLGPHGPGSLPPACTLLSRTYHEPHPPSSSRSKPSGRPPIPVTFPPTSSIRWNRNATPPRLGATAGHTPRRSAATAAANAAARLRPVRRDGDSALAFIYRRFSLGSSWSTTTRKAKSRVSVVSRSEHLALLRWSSGELLQRQPSNRGPTGRDSRSSSRQSSKCGRFAQEWERQPPNVRPPPTYLRVQRVAWVSPVSVWLSPTTWPAGLMVYATLDLAPRVLRSVMVPFSKRKA
jgi:hypothetical protein